MDNSIQSIAIVDLFLDGQNPRHTPVDGTKACIAKLLEDQPNKLIELAKDIAEKGELNPSELMIVVEEDGLKIVLEGNRRIAAVKLLNYPDLAPDNFVKRFENIARTATSIPTVATCYVATNREEARKWLSLRHLGENGGRGIVPWSAEQQQRYNLNPSSQAGIAVQLLDGMAPFARVDDGLAAEIQNFRQAQAMTTLGRLIQDPFVRNRLGLEFEADGLKIGYSAEATVKAIKQILADFSGDGRRKARDINTKSQRESYLRSIESVLPTSDDRLSDPIRPQESTLSRPKKQKPGQETPRPAPSKRPIRTVFEGLTLTYSSLKASALLRECRQITIDGHVVTSAVLLRIMIDIMLDEANHAGDWGKGNLTSRLPEAFRRIDPHRFSRNHHDRNHQLDDAFRLTEKGNAFEIESLHNFVHNWSSNPTAEEVRRHSAALLPFLSALDTYIGEQRNLEASKPS